MMENSYSLADIAAATGNGNNGNGGAWGDGGWLWIIVVFALLFGWGNGGWGGFGGGNGGGQAVQGALTREQACIDNNFQNLMRETAGISDAVNVGFANLNSTICNQQYDTAQMINGLGTTIQGGFNAANVVALQGQNALQRQIADCCCETREAIQGINYNMAQNTCAITNQMNNNTRDIIQSQESGTRAILDYLCQQNMQAKDETIARLRADNNTQYIINQVKGIVNPPSVPAYPGPAPCGLGNWSPAVLANGYGYNGGCNCGNGFAVA